MLKRIEVTFEEVIEHKVSIVANSFEEAAQKLDAMFEAGEEIKGVKTGRTDIRIIQKRVGW